MNYLLDNTISVDGLNGAMEIAAALIKNGYQVFIQNDDMDIYVVSYAYNNLSYGDKRFALITQDEEMSIAYDRQNSAATDENDDDNYTENF